MATSVVEAPVYGRPQEVCPPSASVEGVSIVAFEDAPALFQRIAQEIRSPRQSLITYVNAHVVNTAFRLPWLKRFLQSADVVYCDGAGIQWAARLNGQRLPTRLPAADWFLDLFRFLAQERLSVFLLGGEPGVATAMTSLIAALVPGHTVAGCHHGYFLDDPAQEQAVIAEINRLKPDLLVVGLGTPIQEHWVQRCRAQLDVRAILPLGAVMDYFTGRQPRCPRWMGDAGLEWLFRLSAEPRRLMGRYVLGNPWFLGRICLSAGPQRLQALLSGGRRRSTLRLLRTAALR